MPELMRRNSFVFEVFGVQSKYFFKLFWKYQEAMRYKDAAEAFPPTLIIAPDQLENPRRIRRMKEYDKLLREMPDTP